jgi:probable rRNA maturation factor
MAIHYFDEGVRSGLKQKRKLSAFLLDLLQRFRAPRRTTINFVFCDDAYLLEKNQQFLNHDTLTDIITFDLSENEEDLYAEIYISKERLEENALKFEVPYQRELHRIIFHGVLHLCGFKDKSKADKACMTEMENECLSKYFEQL